MASFFVELLSAVLLYSLVFGMTATVEISHMRKQAHNSVALLIGASIQFLILPFVGFITVQIFRLPAEVGITLLVITSSPGGSYSNWWCSMFNADLALSVTMTALSTLLATVMLPTNLVLYTRWTYSADVVKSLDWRALFISLVVVLGGILSGLFVSHYTSRQIANGGSGVEIRRNANRMGNIAGLALILLSFTVSSTNHDAALWDQDASFYAACALPPIIGLVLAVSLSSRYNLEKPERVAVSVESCYQNTGIATTVALTMFKTESELATAIGVPLCYGIVEAIVIVSFCLICWKIGWTKAPANENLCKVITTSYEVEPQHDTEQESTSIEVVFGDHGMDGVKRHDLIFSNIATGGDYVVDDESLQHAHEQQQRRRSIPGKYDFDNGDCETDPTECSASCNSDGSVKEGDGIMLMTPPQSRRRRRIYDAINFPDSPTLTESTDETNDRSDQHQNKARLGGRKAFAGIRALAAGYRSQMPSVSGDDGEDHDRENVKSRIGPCDAQLPLSSSNEDGANDPVPRETFLSELDETKSTRQHIAEKVSKLRRGRSYHTVATTASSTGSSNPIVPETFAKEFPREKEDDDLSL